MKTKDLLERFEKDYREEKRKEAEDLHNAVAQVLADQRAEVQTVLYVLEMLRFEVLKEKYEQLFADFREKYAGRIRDRMRKDRAVMTWKQGNRLDARKILYPLCRRDIRACMAYVAMFVPYPFVHYVRLLVSRRAIVNYDL